jgi:pimeloyl-ACP methyl ester carboxylesterase
MKTRAIETPYGRIAAHESAGRGPAAVLLHGNSSSSRAFSRQLDGPLGERFRLIALDLPGHGASDDARDPLLYSMENQARTLRAAIDAIGLAGACVVGWSLGGHLALELAPDLPGARGFVIFGTPPLPFPPVRKLGFLPHPAMRAGAAETLDRAEAEAYVAAFFRPGFGDVPPFFLEDALRADGRARSGVNASLASGRYRDEAVVVRDLESPLAVLHGADEQLVNGAYFATLTMPTLWRGAVQTIEGAGHAPQWETPQAFDALVAAFLEETA